ncbi:MAG: DNA repair protein RecN [Acutalibacteraceae bacterium]|nr:DNA repair protein RecN [Acutalibacteraceae bacterium]
MLKFLHIENIAVIESSDIEFTEGFNVLTGETGAGKSIVIDAINAVLGERTSKELIRAGCDTAEVSAVFGNFDDGVISILNEYGVTPDDDGNIIIRRRLSQSGKGLIKLNNRPVTVTELKSIGKLLVNIHGQHDSQSLLDPEKHINYIDAVANDESVKEKYYAEFKELNRIRRELESLETDEDEKLRQTELLKYQINELSLANIRVGEYAELKRKLDIARDYETTVSALAAAYTALKGNDEENGAVSLVADAVKSISGLKNAEWEKQSARLNDIKAEIEEVSFVLSDFLDNTEYSDIDSDTVNARLDFLDKLMLKYGDGEENLLNYLSDAEKKLEKLDFSDKKIAELSEQLDLATEKLIKFGEKLTEVRNKASGQFSSQVCDILNYLNMPQVRFSVKTEKGRYTKNGCDNIEFMISANKGESEKPLAKIASGGELSRVMLAIKSVLLDNDKVGTMIFDEIDTGISGYTAGKVGIQLKKVSENRQVICVTHLAQIAAMADNHLLIEKNVSSARTFTKVSPLSYEERINEIARIMSGAEMTENLYNSAKELLDRSRTI